MYVEKYVVLYTRAVVARVFNKVEVGRQPGQVRLGPSTRDF
jgi:hypothetical protein